MNLTVRLATPADEATIVAFNAAMARETEHLELDSNRIVQGVRAILTDPSKGFYILAEVDGEVAGQMCITYEWSDWRNSAFWWIQSVYVVPAFRRKGVFRSLYQHVLDKVETTQGLAGLRLYVEKNNTKAQGTYESLGMRKAPYDMYELDLVIQR